MDETVVETPGADTPIVEAPATGAPNGEVQGAEIPAADAPALDTPGFDAPALDIPTVDAPAVDATVLGSLSDTFDRMIAFIDMGGAAMWVIAILSMLTVALILWKVLRLISYGAWSGGRHSERAIALWSEGRIDAAQAEIAGRGSLRARLVRAAMQAASDPSLDETAAKAETARVARHLLLKARTGLRALELASTIGPLLGLLGTVTGMIAAFQALQEAGARADPATLAGGIWEALLTTAAGMAVAIPAQIALTWFESVVDRLRHDMEDAATRIFQRAPRAAAPRRSTPIPLSAAAE